jgi:hypothetical protein
MKKILLAALAAMVLIPMMNAQQSVQQEKRYKMYGVMFYNLENLFDTINANGTYDVEFSPNGARQWDGRKYWMKIDRMAYAISQMKTDNTPYGPAIIGVSEIENITVLQDLVRDPQIRNWRLQIAPYHDSPDRRGVDVGLLYNPRYFSVLNVTNQRLSEEDFDRARAAADEGRKGEYEWNDNFRTRDQMCVVGLLAGDTVAVIVNHWPSRLGGQEASSPKREAAGYMCRRTIDSLVNVHGEHIGIIFMGDLNDDPMDKACAESVGGKRNIEEVNQPGEMFNPFWNILARGIGTLAYRGQWNLFDQIMCNGFFTKYREGKDKPQLTFVRAEALNRDFLKTQEGDRKGYPLRTYSSGVFLNGYSDHFPTEIFLVKEAQ